jgi:hypothetical protein
MGGNTSGGEDFAQAVRHRLLACQHNVHVLIDLLLQVIGNGVAGHHPLRQ